MTSPTNADTGGAGVGDADKDSDGDALTNAAEFSFGTDPLDEDSDDDGIADAFEVGASPATVPDADCDGLDDEIEGMLGSNPAAADSDGNGVGDADDSFTLSHLASAGKTRAYVQVTGTGRALGVRAPSGNLALAEDNYCSAIIARDDDPAAEGQLGPSVALGCQVPGATATVSLEATALAKAGRASAWWRPGAGAPEPAADAAIDAAGSTATFTVTLDTAPLRLWVQR
jgi:hypothetical protein